ncbi:rCG40839, partial [Rattus norvegicus]
MGVMNLCGNLYDTWCTVLLNEEDAMDPSNCQLGIIWNHRKD